MATDWGYEEDATDALTRLTNLIDEAAASTVDDEDLRISVEAQNKNLTVTDDGSFNIVDSSGNVIEEPLDVSSATVTVDDGGSFAVNSGPLDASLSSNGTDSLLVDSNSALTVTDNGSFDISNRAGREVGKVRLEESGGTLIDPREETSDHRTGSSVELDSASGGGTVTESMSVMGRPDKVRVIVQNATGNYSVDVQFDNTSVSLQSGASTNLETTQKAFSNTTIDVVISDDSGASNTVDYDLLLI